MSTPTRPLRRIDPASSTAVAAPNRHRQLTVMLALPMALPASAAHRSGQQYGGRRA
jgi:hypothetical protein